ncbi:unnamed protein product [Adineta steineri]|nr:unnamed protein product [Adineta steineri]
MTSRLIYNVPQDCYAISLYGELTSTRANECCIVVAVFEDNSTLIQHRSDIDLSAESVDNDAMVLYESIVNNIASSKGTQSVIK